MYLLERHAHMTYFPSQEEGSRIKEQQEAAFITVDGTDATHNTSPWWRQLHTATIGYIDTPSTPFDSTKNLVPDIPYKDTASEKEICKDLVTLCQCHF